VLLLGGVLCKQDAERVDALLAEVLDGLGGNAPLCRSARCVGVGRSRFAGSEVVDYQIADARYRENLQDMPAVFDAEAARTIDFQTRPGSGDALGQAGDPRLSQANWVRVEWEVLDGGGENGSKGRIRSGGVDDEARRSVDVSSFVAAIR